MSKDKNSKPFLSWGKNKPKLTRVSSQFFVGMAEDSYEALEIVWDGLNTAKGQTLKLTDVFEQPDTNEWLKLYHRRHDLQINALVHMSGSDNPKEDAQAYHLLRSEFASMRFRPEETVQEGLKYAKEQPEEFKKIVDSLSGFEFSKEDLIDKPEKDISEARLKHIPSDIKLQFMLRVFLPCFAHYQTMPSQLMRKARSGNINALCDLIKLDKLVIYDKKLKKVIAGIMHDRPAVFRKTIAKALSSSITPLKKRAFKNAIGGFLHSNFKDFGKLSTMDIRNCFDAFATAKSGNAIDTDLQDDEEAHKKAIVRSRDRWNDNYMQL